jgi:hypothetical protein
MFCEGVFDVSGKDPVVVGDGVGESGVVLRYLLYWWTV